MKIFDYLKLKRRCNSLELQYDVLLETKEKLAKDNRALMHDIRGYKQEIRDLKKELNEIKSRKRKKK